MRLDEAQDFRELTDEEKQLRKALKVRVLGLTAVERSRRRQCSRLTWLKEGDACTKFFHLKANARRRKNFIPCFKSQAGILLWSHEDKKNEIFNHFMSTLGTKEQRTCTLNWSELALPPVSAAGLDAAFTEEEIWAAIAEMPAEKASGPDGFTATFYKFCWPIIKCAVVCGDPQPGGIVHSTNPRG